MMLQQQKMQKQQQQQQQINKIKELVTMMRPTIIDPYTCTLPVGSVSN
jgi:hypothetical protein